MPLTAWTEVPQIQVVDRIVEIPQVQNVIREIPRIEVEEVPARSGASSFS